MRRTFPPIPAPKGNIQGKGISEAIVGEQSAGKKSEPSAWKSMGQLEGIRLSVRYRS